LSESIDDLVRRLVAEVVLPPTALVQCSHTYGEHRCFLYNCPKDDPDHVHVCYADDFDWKEGDHTRFRLGRIDEPEFWVLARLVYGKRRAEGLSAITAQDRSIAIWKYGADS